MAAVIPQGLPKLGIFKMLRTQFQTIVALAIREMEAQYGRYRMGYAWALFEPTMYVALISTVRISIKGSIGGNLHGMTAVMFIMCGVLPWRTFSLTAMSTYRVPAANRVMLQLPGVTVLDLIMAHALGEFCTYNFVFLVLAVPVSIVEHAWPPGDLLNIIVLYELSWVMGVGLGMTLIPIYMAVPAMENVIGTILRIGFWTSGLFFVIVQFPSWTWPYFAWNPMLNVTEMIRHAWFPVYVSPLDDMPYVAECAFGFLILGLLGERLVRHRLRSS